MENKIFTQFDNYGIEVPEYVKVRINNSEKPLIDFCNDVIKKFEELSDDPLQRKVNALVDRLEAEYMRDMTYRPYRFRWEE